MGYYKLLVYSNIHFFFSLLVIFNAPTVRFDLRENLL